MTLRDGTRDDLLAAQRRLRNDAAVEQSDALRADILVYLGLVGSALDDPSTRDTLIEVVHIAERLEDHVLRMYVLNNLAENELRDDDQDLAAQHQLEALRLSAELGVPVITVFGLILASRIVQPRGLHDTATRLHGAADAILDDCGYEMFPDDQELSDVMLRAARDALGDGFEPAYRAGRGLAPIEALELAETVLCSDRLAPPEGAARR